MALLSAGPMPRPIPRMPQTPPSSMIDPSGSLYGGAGALPNHGTPSAGPMPRPIPRMPQNHGTPMPGQSVMNAAYGPAASNPAAAVHAGVRSSPLRLTTLPAAMSRFAPSQLSLSNLLAAAAGSHPVHHPVHAPSGEEPSHGFLPPQAGNYAQLLPLLRALVPNPNFSY
jgi:hypothetical protein